MARLTTLLLLTGAHFSLQSPFAANTTSTLPTPTATFSILAIPTRPPNPFCNQQGIPNLISNYLLDSIRTPSVFACQTACTSYGMGIGCLSYMFARNDALDAQTTDWQNCNLYSIEIGLGGMGLWWNNPVSGQWFSDRLFAGSLGCYQPGDVVGDTKDS